jgi:hypothetical protein
MHMVPPLLPRRLQADLGPREFFVDRRSYVDKVSIIPYKQIESPVIEESLVFEVQQ